MKKLLSEDILIENEFDIISLTEENNFYNLMLKVKDDKSDNQIKFVFDRESLDLKNGKFMMILAIKLFLSLQK